MSKTNCVNCGAAKDTSDIKCPFCGTTYLDFTAIDFTSQDPVVCQFVLPTGRTSDRAVIQMLAIPRMDSIEVTDDTVDVTTFGGTPLYRFVKQRNLQANIHFDAVARQNNTLCELRYKEDNKHDDA